MKKKLISILTLIFIILSSSYSYAANTGMATLSVSKDTIKAGDEFSVIVNASDTNNLNTVEYSAVTITDENGNATPAISVKSVEPVGDNWAKMNADGKTNFVYSGGATQSSEVFKVTFTVGDNISEGNYIIKIDGIKIYSAQDDTTDIGTKTISIKAIIDDTTAGNQGGTNGGTQTPEEDDGNGSESGNSSNDGNNDNNSGNNKPNSSSEDKNTDKDKNVSSNKNTTKTNNKNTTKLPQTGAESVSIIAIIALGIISIASYISYRKYKNI